MSPTVYIEPIPAAYVGMQPADFIKLIGIGIGYYVLMFCIVLAAFILVHKLLNKFFGLQLSLLMIDVLTALIVFFMAFAPFISIILPGIVLTALFVIIDIPVSRLLRKKYRI